MLRFIRHVWQRGIWSTHGLRDTYRQEYSFRCWVWLNVVSAGAALALPLPGAYRAMILALGVLVLACELINTAIERAVDHTSTDHHPLAKEAKDAGSAAVAVTAAAAGVAWIVALWEMALG